MTGKVAIAAGAARLVSRIPPNKYAMETNEEAIGPLSAKSSKAVLVDGNDFNGVMQPKRPSCGEGKGTGYPILIFLSFATK